MDGAGFNARASDTVMQDMWEKFAQLGVGAGITCLMRTSIGDIMAAPGGRDATLRLFDECGAVASAAGFRPRDAFVQNSLALVTAAGSPLKWSMLRDIERGSTTEGEHILGDMVARPTRSASRHRSWSWLARMSRHMKSAVLAPRLICN
ncbi:MAG: ketopantoate reductase C-terminal domain-containing protein [Bradyrhizobium sp.]